MHSRPVSRHYLPGITLYFFNNKFEKISNVNSPEAVMQQFGEKEPGGGTKLAAVRFVFSRTLAVAGDWHHTLPVLLQYATAALIEHA